MVADFSVSTAWRDTLHLALLTWYDEQARTLPWRSNPTPYRVWMSEIMLQQTQVTTVLPYFERWMAKFPTVTDLAEAPLETVLKTWEGLGYYARARNLHKAAQVVVQEYNGELPDTVEGLLKLPGIGVYTAGAIASIAFGRKAAAVDGNLKRVFARLMAYEPPINTPSAEKDLWAIAEVLLPEDRAGDWNQALMDLGATICLPRNPRCLLCPLRDECRANQLGLVHELPRKNARAPRPHYTVVAGVIWNPARDYLLIAQRPHDKMLGGLWEFPGGKIEAGETLEAGLQRELREELAIEVEVGDELTIVDHAYTHFSITLHAFHCIHRGGDPQAIGVADFRWMRPDELLVLPYPRTDLQIIQALQTESGNGGFTTEDTERTKNDKRI
jgi:A/G-specific adenine glycosylase